MRAERCGEEPACCSKIALGGDQHVDDLAVLVDGAIHVSPFAGDLHVGLIDIPAVADQVGAWHGRVRSEWSEAPQIPTRREDDDLGPEAVKPFETGAGYRVCMSASSGSLIHATVGSAGGVGGVANRDGFLA